MISLLKIKDAAKMLGVPSTDLEAAANKHGLLVRFRKTTRIEEESLKELIRLCRVEAKEPGSTGGSRKAAAKASTSSGTAKKSSQRARETAEKLKRNSAGI